MSYGYQDNHYRVARGCVVFEKVSGKHLDDEDLDMLPRLKFNYDSLKNDDLRMCFLYCLLWPEDHEIYELDLMAFCIGNDLIKDFDGTSEVYKKETMFH